MQHHLLLSAALALFGASGAMSQTTTTNPLNNFIGAAASALSQINSNLAAESTSASSSTSATATPTSSSTSAATAAATSAAAASSGSGIKRRNTIIIVVCVVIGLLLLGLLLGALFCCLARRRRRRRTTTPVHDEEIEAWRSSQPSTSSGSYGRVASTEHQPTVPAMAMVEEHSLLHHPANRRENPFSQQSALRPENPFVPVPPSPRRAPHSREGLTGGIVPAAAAGAVAAAPLSQRRAPNSREGLTDGTIPGAPPFIAPRAERQRMRSFGSPARGRSEVDLNQDRRHGGVPSQRPGEQTVAPFGLIGQPYDDMHVHVLQGEAPSAELRNSLNSRDPVGGYNTAPRVPGRSPRRAAFADSTYSSTDGSTSLSGSGSGSGEDWRHSQIGTVNTGTVPWEQSPHKHSNSPLQSMQASPASMRAPPIPWTGGERKHSGSPRASMGAAPWAERRSSQSPRQSFSNTPRQSQSGPPRRLRFSDFPETEPGHNHRYSQGVGEAL